MKEEEVKKAVKEGYAAIAKKENSCCSPAMSCCGGTDSAQTISRNIGYSDEELKSVPDGANLGLGCGNPVALASLQPGEVVLDLGSGAGFDCFLASQKVGAWGRVIGIDMTPEMVEKAQENARQGGYKNVEFKLGEIEKLPVPDNYVDVVISNCVINLSPEKGKVFREAYRVLRPGGRLMVSDIVLLKELPKAVKDSVGAYVGCLSGAMQRDDYIGKIRASGFWPVGVVEETRIPIELMANDPTAQALMQDLKITPEEAKELANSAVSIKVSALKPSRRFG